eukprot:CAMPEP_0201530820 /NCGR_PEP_ID=MMETSP0161_2-20130828/45806_1 /ASSEMBLY_ACC=CAM_ASM_000251 /TAXON_ID=180227 /ORGANISM="Neoparamoeba aestuarina, Strain SoJaBio B1-5/56/2" /LENGTH=39 /DNA_ID= /DNA_START= /DNA_END= /DNA_ORIENTATION=
MEKPRLSPLWKVYKVVQRDRRLGLKFPIQKNKEERTYYR